MFEKFLANRVCIFPEANSAGRKIFCALAGVATTASTFYVLRHAYYKYDKWQASRPEKPFVFKSDLEKKRSDMLSVMPFSALGLCGVAFIGCFAGKDGIDSFKHIYGSRACCDIIRSTAFFTMRIPFYGALIAMCAYPTRELYYQCKIYQNAKIEANKKQ